jgi:predicted transcriptional regulator
MTISIKIGDATYELPDETARTLIEIAKRNNVTPEVALKQAILNEKFIEEQTTSGAKLLIERNGSLNELVLKPASSV